MRELALAAMLAAGLAVPATALAQTRVNVRGAIVESNTRGADHPPMVVRGDDGALVSIELALNAEAFRVFADAPTAIVPAHRARAIVERAGNGTLHARVVMVFPDNIADGLDGEEAWDRPPSSMRIQGTIAAAAPDGTAVVIALRSGDAQSTIVADAATIVVGVTGANDRPYDRGDHVFVAATRQRDGRVTAGRVFYGKDGFVPPM